MGTSAAEEMVSAWGHIPYVGPIDMQQLDMISYVQVHDEYSGDHSQHCLRNGSLHDQELVS